MRTTHLLSILLISAGIVTGGALLTPAFAQNASSMSAGASASSSADWLTIPQVIQRLESSGYRDFEEVDRESDSYEVKATDPEGRRVEIYVDPVTAEVLKTEIKRDKRS